MTTLPKNMPEIVHSELQARCERYRQLMERNIPILFPQGVDIALNFDRPLDELLGSEDYVAWCRETNNANADLYRTDQWTPEVLASGELPDGTLLVDALCESWLRHLHSYRLYDWQEHRTQLRHAIIVGAGDFDPAKVQEATGEYQSYMAWINVYVFPNAIRRLKREHHHEGRTISFDCSEEESDAIPEPSYENDIEEIVDALSLRESVVRILGRLSWTDRTLDMVCDLAFRDESMRGTGSRHGISHVHVGRLLKPLREAFIKHLRLDFPESQSLKSFDLLAFMGLIGRLFTEDDFIDLGLLRLA